ncbi:dihydroorotase [Bacteroidota bacterium]|nr:dihydroorotase [Bacteroidota bacterium]MDC3229776.1 dihydroorotase [Bacteroidota bacterium]
MKTLIKNSFVVDSGTLQKKDILISNDIIQKVSSKINIEADRTLDYSGLHIIPGVIDDQVHFREPGLTHKGDIYSESKAAVAGGITSFMEMPNTSPQTLTQDLLKKKFLLGEQKSLANFSFFMGASNDNINEVLLSDPKKVGAIKIFMGSSTGNMLVNKLDTLNELFKKSRILLVVHCEDEDIINKNLNIYKEKYGNNIPINCHPKIRTEEACFKSSSLAIELAKKHKTRLHIFHISTAKELSHFTNDLPVEKKQITSEACIHHLWFSEKDYDKKGAFIKWNPSVKTENDKKKLIDAVNSNLIDVVASDHAPHTIIEKNNNYIKCPSGGPLVQHSLVAMLDLYHDGLISLEKIVEKMCHNPAKLFRIKKRGFIKEGYYADLTILDLNKSWTVSKENILYKCGWSPFDGHTFKSSVQSCFVNGNLVYNSGEFDESFRGLALEFDV